MPGITHGSTVAGLKPQPFGPKLGYSKIYDINWLGFLLLYKGALLIFVVLLLAFL